MNPPPEYNEDEINPPEWLNEDFLQQMIDNGADFEQGLKIFTFTIQPATLKGDHYASIMFRATIECTRETSTETFKTLQVIIKTTPPLDTPKGRNLSETQIFENEWKMYTQVIPLLETEWRRHGENLQFAGRLLYATLHPQPVIVLEDLCLAGYDILRGRPFNLTELEACLGKLAKWHAVSYKLTATTTPTSTTTTTTTSNSSSSSNITNAHAVNATNVKGQDNASVTKARHVAIVSDYRDGTNDDDNDDDGDNSFNITNTNNTNTNSTTSATNTISIADGNKVDDECIATSVVTNAACTLTQMRQGLFTQKSMLSTPCFSKGVKHMIAAFEEAATLNCADNDNSFEEYITKLRLLEPHIITACCDMNDAFAKGIRGPIYVLNHGDIHYGNIMIHKALERQANDSINKIPLEENDILFIDFQESFFGPSVFDLQLANINFYSHEIRVKKKDQLLRHYFDNFVSSLRKLCFEGEYPTYEQFLEDQKRWRCFEIYLLGVFLPFTFGEETDIDFNRVMEDEDFRQTYYRNPHYLEYLRKLLPIFLKEGYLEIFEKY